LVSSKERLGRRRMNRKQRPRRGSRPSRKLVADGLRRRRLRPAPRVVVRPTGGAVAQFVRAPATAGAGGRRAQLGRVCGPVRVTDSCSTTTSVPLATSSAPSVIRHGVVVVVVTTCREAVRTRSVVVSSAPRRRVRPGASGFWFAGLSFHSAKVTPVISSAASASRWPPASSQLVVRCGRPRRACGRRGWASRRTE
jgi:hypothetical protein